MKKILMVVPVVLLLLLLYPVEVMAIYYFPKFIFHGDFSEIYFYLPIYLGFLALPGYLYVALSKECRGFVNVWVRWWVRLSLLAAIVACILGSYVGRYLYLHFPLTLICIVICSRLLYSFERTIATGSIK